MKKAVIISVSGVLVVAVAVAGVWYWYSSKKDDVAVNSAGGSVALNTAQAGDGAGTVSLPLDGQQSGGGNTGSNGLAVQSNTAAAPKGAVKGSTNSNQEPENLQQYEQYKTAKTAMFGEIAVGDGQAVAGGNTVTLSYRGWLTNGTLFDDSYVRHQLLTFTVGQHKVIPGFEEAIVGMKAGGKRRMIIPPDLGYGNQATGPIPANSLLVFDVELLEVK